MNLRKVHGVRTVHTVLLALLVAMPARTASAQDDWYSLQVPGGRATLRTLGVDDTRERSWVMIELIRRLHFSTRAPEQLEAAIRNIPTQSSETLTLPQPLATATWERLLGRALPPRAMFRAILSDTPARLLYHGLAGMNAETRQWIEREPELLRSLYRDLDAAKSFAMFAPGIEISQGRVIIPGGAVAEARWSHAIGVSPADARRFVSRLFLDRAGRVAGLYFLAASVGAPRRQFVLHAYEAGGDVRFARLVDTFASCYPRDSNDYPFVLRSNDPALLLLSTRVTDDGRFVGPLSEPFRDSVFATDAAAIVERLCSAQTRDRGAVFATVLTGQRVFSALTAQEADDVVVALRVRRMFPAVFMAMERAGVRRPATYGVVGRHALQLDRLNDAQSTPALLQQFQGALAMVLRMAASGTLTQPELERLLHGLCDVRIANGRYDGRLAAWFERELLPAIRFPAGGVVEFAVAGALAGPPASSPVRIRWEDHDYVVDHSRSMRDRLLGVRNRQGGHTLDTALEMSRAARADGDAQAADIALGQALAAWAYAPHVGSADSVALVGGDPSRRHDIGLREVNRTRFEQRWALSVAPGDRGVIAGSYLGLEATLATWSLRRLTADIIPPEPTIGDNDRMALYAMVSLSDPARMTDEEMQRIANAVDDGRAQVTAAGHDASRLAELGRAASMSPWRRVAMRWTLAEEPSRVSQQFSLSALARLGGVAPGQLPAWGTSAVPLGCLCLASPIEGAPELIAGRPVDGIVGIRSADLPLRVAQILSELKMPAQLMPAVLAYAMRDYIDRLRPMHPADVDAFADAALSLTRTMVEDYLGAIAAVGPLRPVQ